MTQADRPQYCCTTGGALCFFFAIFALVYGALLLLMQAIPALRAYGTALLFAAAGTACLANFGRNRTFHCAITGPFFLLVGAVAAAGAAGWWRVPLPLVWPLVLIVVGAALLLERHYAA